MKRGGKVTQVYVFAYYSPWCLFLQGICPFTFEFFFYFGLVDASCILWQGVSQHTHRLKELPLVCPFWAFYPLGLTLGKQAAATPMELPTTQFILHWWSRWLLVSQRKSFLCQASLILVLAAYLGDNTVKHITSCAIFEMRWHKRGRVPCFV